MFQQGLLRPRWSCLRRRGQRVNEVPRKEARCQPGSVTHRRLFPRVLGTETLEKPGAWVCQRGGAFPEGTMLRDRGSKGEAEGEDGVELGGCCGKGDRGSCSVFPLPGGVAPGCARDPVASVDSKHPRFV